MKICFFVKLRINLKISMGSIQEAGAHAFKGTLKAKKSKAVKEAIYILISCPVPTSMNFDLLNKSSVSCIM